MKFAVFILLLASIGCAKKAATKLPDLEIPASCVKQVVMKDCDTRADPPKCKRDVVVYSPPSCPVVHAK